MIYSSFLFYLIIFNFFEYIISCSRTNTTEIEKSWKLNPLVAKLITKFTISIADTITSNTTSFTKVKSFPNFINTNLRTDATKLMMSKATNV